MPRALVVSQAIFVAKQRDVLIRRVMQSLNIFVPGTQVVFVATQSDVLIQSEIHKNLKLDRSTSKAECGRARNAYTRERLKNDFSQVRAAA